MRRTWFMMVSLLIRAPAATASAASTKRMRKATSAIAAVKFMRSTDNGRTWSTPKAADDVPPLQGWACCTFEPSMTA
jgi:hypothetical protein